jgi:hypothetical protein
MLRGQITWATLPPDALAPSGAPPEAEQTPARSA